ncbi:MAG: DNA mismatch repair protein MutS [Planctomycetota bacterium]|nr:DNA mismatch repair protein MutS [Planctomycetota bacterium]
MIRKPDSPAPTTPMMRQYFAAKESHPNALLFFRMGDFYEMFFDDAKDAAELLGIALTSRSKDKDAVPMAGIPVRSADSYLAKLLRAGKRVAICEQVQDPKEAQGIVDREVVRVISPGTITDESVIGEKSNNYIAGLVKSAKGYGLSWLDVTTGQFLIWETTELAGLATQVGRIAPAEVVLPESLAFHLDREAEIERIVREAFQTAYPDPLFDQATAYRTLVEHFETQTLEGFGCERLRLGIRAGGGLLRYVQETQKVSLKHIARVAAFEDRKVLPIDATTRRALEITETSRGERQGSLLASFDHTGTSLGARRLREWLLAPLTEVEAILQRQEGVAALLEDASLRDRVATLLRQVHDLERISTRISYGSANARDLLSLARTLEIVPELAELLADAGAAVLQQAAGRLSDLPELRDLLSRALVSEPPLSTQEGGLIREGFHADLDELRQISREGRQWFARFQQQEAERTGINSLKVGFNKVFGYYLEVTNANREKIPRDYIRKQTLKNCERFITPELKEYENKVLHARERAVELEQGIFVDLRENAAAHIAEFQETAGSLAEIDVLCTFARLASDRDYVRPHVNAGERLYIEEGRHPVLEEMANTEPFIPNSIDLGGEHHIMIITGPNMAGKSTYIRQVALLTLLAQTGSFIPAKSAEIGVIDRLFTRVGASDDLTRGQSTFMVEMNETASILNNATRRSLIVLDEVGRGTSTFDGVSLAWAITEYIAEKVGARTLFATHYHELTTLTRNHAGARNFNFAVKEWNEDIIFLRKIVEGGADKSYGIHVARLAGIPHDVVERAKEILANLENQSLDIHDQPSLAHKRHPGRTRPPGGADGEKSDKGETGPPPLQLDLFQSPDHQLVKELRKIDLDRMTPLEALQYLADLKRRL